MDRNNLTEIEAKKRIKAQMPLEKKAERSNFVIENSGSEKDMEEQALGIIRIIMESNHHWKLRGILLTTVFSIIAGVTWFLNKKYKFLESFKFNLEN
jgi:hypothetical protein